jgi:hypothetical protein
MKSLDRDSRPLLLAAIVLSLPLLGGSADPAPSPSGSAAAEPEKPAAVPLSAALFAEPPTAAPPEEAWQTARAISGIRMGRDARKHGCSVKHVGAWVRVGCDALDTGRIDLLTGETRDLSFRVDKDAKGYLDGDSMFVQFSMRAGDRRIVQWASPDMWVWVWRDGPDLMASGAQPVGGMLGVVLQVDWASGTEPVITLH